jgi:hypothetical protein
LLKKSIFIFIAAGFLIFHPSDLTDILGIGLTVAGIAVHFVGKSVVGQKTSSRSPDDEQARLPG